MTACLLFQYDTLEISCLVAYSMEYFSRKINSLFSGKNKQEEPHLSDGNVSAAFWISDLSRCVTRDSMAVKPPFESTRMTVSFASSCRSAIRR